MASGQGLELMLLTLNLNHRGLSTGGTIPVEPFPYNVTTLRPGFW